MNKKDIAEIKRRFNLEHNNITCIRGCYVNDQGQVISSFTRSLVGMAQEEAEKYLAIFKRTLSGNQGQNLLDIDFDPEAMESSPEYRLLTDLKNTALKDDEAVESFFQQIIGSLQPEDHYLILLMHDGYDIPYRSKEDDSGMADMGTEVFHYILCSVCPVRLTKPSLSYDAGKNDFRSKESDWIVGAPEMGFLFPAFEERAANVNQALYYTRDTAEGHGDFVNAVFRSALPMPADRQKEIFQSILQETLEEDCSYEVMQAVHEQVMERLEERRQEKNSDPLEITKYDVADVLKECGVSTAHMEAFNDKYDMEFGRQARIPAANITNPKQFEVKTPSVVIKVNSDRTDLVETRFIDGHRYILIRADEDVEVNGVSVTIPE
ncbi:MAG: DUF4317 domain-containing protein [Clostridia bacterium]|nr:DUF4317 domain-containing protein [Clostridia bacterium]